MGIFDGHLGEVLIVLRPDTRSAWRKAEDERIAAESHLPPPPVTSAPLKPLEEHLLYSPRRLLAIEGVVQNGVVRPLDPGISLPEGSRVIIVALGSR
jgi:hypothetical protein